MKIYRPNDRCNIVGEQVRLLRKKQVFPRRN